MLSPNISGTAWRCIGVLVLLPIIAAVFFDARIASIVIALIAVGMAYEFGKMVTMPMLAKLTLCLCIILQALPIWLVDLGPWWHAGLACLAFVITLTYHQLLESVFALVLALCLYFTVLVLSEPSGHWQLLMLAAVIAACDSAAYFVGRFIGGAKLASAISPNKTISGSVGGIIAAMAVMPGIAPFLELGPVMALMFGLGLAVLSQIGDLHESALKRRLNVKDSGAILPGHGGLLDRFDGYLFTVPGFYLFFFAI